MKDYLEKSKEHLKEHKPFKVIFDGDDFGTYYYDKKMDAYTGIIGFIPIKNMMEAIINSNYFIKVVPVYE